MLQATDVEIERVLREFADAEVLNNVFVRNARGYFFDFAAMLLENARALDRPLIVGLNGSQGSGKSTLVNLIPRFYQQSEGEILLDNIPITDLTLRNLRSHVALVSQQVVLFNGSIRDNIAYGELQDAAPAKIYDALDNANARGFVDELPEELDTKIGDDGFLLSGGQRQRLAIARALLKNAPVLILDEATSALDSESEKAIQSALEHLMQGRTTFVIAHRLSTIESADRILVMEKGRIVESGSHTELMAAGGAYQKLHELQFNA